MTEDLGKISWPGWEIVRLIGRGSFGAVYEIERNILGYLEKAALKVISIPQNTTDLEDMYGDGYDDESIVTAFQSHLKSIIEEYAIMRKMNDCANVVTCEDVRYAPHEDGIGWDIAIKMELLTPLVKTLPDKISEDTVVHLGKDICNALVMCSQYNIVHRDIKPQNIFVSERGDYKLGDFGIAKTVEKTMGGTKIGTYRYMAPEVYNNKPYGSGADIYSLGLVLYWLLNERRLPFLPLPPVKLKAGMDEEARQRRLLGKEALPPPAHGSEVLRQIVLKACAYEPGDRYRSAADMLADLNAYSENRTISTKVKYEENSEDRPVTSDHAPISVVHNENKTEQQAVTNIIPIMRDESRTSKPWLSSTNTAIVLPGGTERQATTDIIPIMRDESRTSKPWLSSTNTAIVLPGGTERQATTDIIPIMRDESRTSKPWLSSANTVDVLADKKEPKFLHKLVQKIHKSKC